MVKNSGLRTQYIWINYYVAVMFDYFILMFERLDCQEKWKAYVKWLFNACSSSFVYSIILLLSFNFSFLGYFFIFFRPVHSKWKTEKNTKIIKYKIHLSPKIKSYKPAYIPQFICCLLSWALVTFVCTENIRI